MDFLDAVKSNNIVYIYRIPKFEAESLTFLYPQVFPVLEGFLKTVEKSTRRDFSLRFENGEARKILLDFDPKYRYMIFGIVKDKPKEYVWNELFIPRIQFDSSFLNKLI